LHQAIETALADLNALALENATVTRPLPAVVEIAIPALEGGAAIYDALIDSFDRILGQSLAAVIVRSYGQEIDNAFYSFGAERRRVVITRGRGSSYAVSEEFQTIAVVGESDPESCESVATLRQRLGNLGALLPPDF
jgi:hypothetical protein